jgi:hypothetical protein
MENIKAESEMALLFIHLSTRNLQRQNQPALEDK